VKVADLLSMSVVQLKKAGGTEVDSSDMEEQAEQAFQEGMKHFRALVAAAEALNLEVFEERPPLDDKNFLGLAKRSARENLEAGFANPVEQQALQAIADAPSPFRAQKVHRGVSVRDTDVLLTFKGGSSRVRYFSFPKDLFTDVS